MSSTTQETFEIDGKTYRADPTMKEFLKDAGFSKSYISRIASALEKQEITEPSRLYFMTKKDLEKLSGITENSAEKIALHAMRVKKKGDVLVDYAKMKEREDTFDYLPSGSVHLDGMLTYSNGKVGFRSKTLIELYGPPGVGKSQLCMTAAALCLRPREKGGWAKGVVYIDSEGAFEGYRFEYLARYWGVDKEFLEDHLLYSRVENFDEVDKALDLVFNKAKDIDLGMIIVDSIMDPLKAQYLVGGEHLSGLQPRQQHLKQVLDKLKNLANMYNAVALYTNHIRAEIATYGATEGPQGGAVMGHASDIRISLEKPNKKETDELIDYVKARDVGIKLGRAKIVDCGFLPETTGFYLVGAMGIADPSNYSEIYKHAEMIQKAGYLCVDSEGNEHPPFEEFSKSSKEYIEENKKKLYGI